MTTIFHYDKAGDLIGVQGPSAVVAAAAKSGQATIPPNFLRAGVAPKASKKKKASPTPQPPAEYPGAFLTSSERKRISTATLAAQPLGPGDSDDYPAEWLRPSERKASGR